MDVIVSSMYSRNTENNSLKKFIIIILNLGRVAYCQLSDGKTNIYGLFTVFDYCFFFLNTFSWTMFNRIMDVQLTPHIASSYTIVNNLKYLTIIFIKIRFLLLVVNSSLFFIIWTRSLIRVVTSSCTFVHFIKYE